MLSPVVPIGGAGAALGTPGTGEEWGTDLKIVVIGKIEVGKRRVDGAVGREPHPDVQIPSDGAQPDPDLLCAGIVENCRAVVRGTIPSRHLKIVPRVDHLALWQGRWRAFCAGGAL